MHYKLLLWGGCAALAGLTLTDAIYQLPVDVQTDVRVATILAIAIGAIWRFAIPVREALLHGYRLRQLHEQQETDAAVIPLRAAQAVGDDMTVELPAAIPGQPSLNQRPARHASPHQGRRR